MIRIHRIRTGLLAITLLAAPSLASSFICAEPGGKRLIEVDGNDLSQVGQKRALSVDGDDIRDRDGKKLFSIDDGVVRPGDTPVGVKLLTIDGDDLRHAAGGKVVMNYQHPNLCPTAADNRIYSIEGDALSKQQLIAGLYLLKPDLFKLSDTELAAQKNAAKEANAEQQKLDAADQVAGKWTMLNSSGIQEKVGQGTITVAEKKGDAYPVTFDLTQGGGPAWTGVGHYALVTGDKTFWVAYGTPKTAALCVYDIDGGKLTGKWSPWYIDGNPKNTGTEVLSGPATLDGDYKIDSAAAPTTGAAYTGTVTIKPLAIVGASDEAKPYSVVWTFGKVKVYGIGIKTGKQFFVASGAGPDLCIAKFVINNGSMTSDWFKFGSTEKGSSAAMTANN
ncbi:MAG: hypothetical protein JWM57_2507 [Phycisphaerales bacterium]|nr:hypothetical protein [Phycisphaerales bacterium]